MESEIKIKINKNRQNSECSQRHPGAWYLVQNNLVMKKHGGLAV